VDDDRQAEVGRQRQLRVEEDALLAQRVGAVVAIEARLADRDRPWMRQQLS
jgi:hypothetical protein